MSTIRRPDSSDYKLNVMGAQSMIFDGVYVCACERILGHNVLQFFMGNYI